MEAIRHAHPVASLQKTVATGQFREFPIAGQYFGDAGYGVSEISRPDLSVRQGDGEGTRLARECHPQRIGDSHRTWLRFERKKCLPRAMIKRGRRAEGKG